MSVILDERTFLLIQRIRDLARDEYIPIDLVRTLLKEYDARMHHWMHPCNLSDLGLAWRETHRDMQEGMHLFEERYPV